MDKYANAMALAFEDELRKIAAEKRALSAAGKAGLAVGAGALGWELIRRANQDRRMGRVMRLQQNGMY